ncbi:MAG: YdeI/OmpD-associated family protein [Pyrinomonadaceae bacterium]|nr:YdeI/OmpD-associated family protein [Pyrinomonadaceae bacterium]
MKIEFFKSAAECRRWLARNHDKVTEQWFGFYKKKSGKLGITYHEALDEALCFGWIDGLKKSVDESSYTLRFTPRKAKSIWSVVNTKRAEELRKLGRMKPAGLKALAARDSERSGIYSFENRPVKLSSSCEKEFKAHKDAWEFFQTQPPGYKRTASFWVMSAKQEATRLRRLAQLISASEKKTRPGKVTGKS